MMPRFAFPLLTGVLLLGGHLTASAAEPGQFTNPLREGADPWVIRDEAGQRWLWCTAPNAERIVIRTTPTLTASGTEHEVWLPAATGPASAQIWAPELHFLAGHWYLYFAASDGRNETHRAFVLSADSADPIGTWTLHGPLATGAKPDGNSPPIWAIDMTILDQGGVRYAVWSGWDTPDSDRQFLYIAKMATPLTLTGPRVRICGNDDYLWERTEETAESRGLNEGPQVLQHAGRTFLLYSCGAAWLPTYKLGLLELTGRDPLDPASWRKHPHPVFQSTAQTLGVGHSCFVNPTPLPHPTANLRPPPPASSPWWHIYHAKRDRAPGWPRDVFLQPFHFDPTGFPDFGQPLAPGSHLPIPIESGLGLSR